VLEREGEPTGLLDAWEGADSLWLADAVSSGSEPGTIHRLDAGEEKLPHSLFRASSHHLGLAEAIELARALGRLPREVVVYGIEGASFDAGTSVTPAVAAAAERVAEAILEEVEECMRRR
jgi:hydrogenase maturation protease